MARFTWYKDYLPLTVRFGQIFCWGGILFHAVVLVKFFFFKFQQHMIHSQKKILCFFFCLSAPKVNGHTIHVNSIIEYIYVDLSRIQYYVVLMIIFKILIFWCQIALYFQWSWFMQKQMFLFPLVESVFSPALVIFKQGNHFRKQKRPIVPFRRKIRGAFIIGKNWRNGYFAQLLTMPKNRTEKVVLVHTFHGYTCLATTEVRPG